MVVKIPLLAVTLPDKLMPVVVNNAMLDPFTPTMILPLATGMDTLLVPFTRAFETATIPVRLAPLPKI